MYPRMFTKNYYVYIITNKWNTVLYTGFTSDLIRRIYQHKQKEIEGFSKKYNLTKLVYFEVYTDPLNGIAREKQIKNGTRKRKIDLINEMNPDWKDLYEVN